MNKKLKFLLIFFLFFTSVFSFNKIEASTSDNFFGQAWSSNIGWINFNNCTSTDLNSCSSTSYGVRLNEDNTISGQAWSSNIGWINFSQNERTQASLNRTTGKISGWAKVISSGEWISLSATDVDQSGWGLIMDLNSGLVSGQAWGDISTGWIVPRNLYISTSQSSLSVIASPDAYNVLKSQSSNTINFSFNVNGSTNYSCRILDNQKNTISGYDYLGYEDGESYAFSGLPDTVGSFGYYLQCKDNINETLAGISNLITVNIADTMYNISATTSSSGGSLYPSGNIQVTKNSNYTFNFLPHNGYYISSILIDGISQHDLSITNYTFTNIIIDHSIHIEFASLVPKYNFCYPENTPCSNGATNPPICNNFCKERCENGASDFPSCTLCIGGTVVTSSQNCPTPSQCSDALDNDEDGFTDMKDPDCLDRNDNLEATSI
jgi:hypothetical protein